MMSLKNSDAIVTAAVQQDLLAPENASEEIKDLEAIVKAAVTQNGLTLKYASAEMKNNDRFARGPPLLLVCWRGVNGKPVQRRAVRHYQWA